MIELDGSFGSGGGQMLRTALALSTLSGLPFRMINIRAGREKPGLKRQHLTCITALECLSGSKVLGDSLGSSEISFFPGKYSARNETFDIKTAGSITLLLQSLILPAMFASKPHTLTLVGGTDVAWSPPIDYFVNVILPQILRFCNNIGVSVKRRGFFPKGGGIVEVRFDPSIDRSSFSSFVDFRKTVSSLAERFSLVGSPVVVSVSGRVAVSKDLSKNDVADRIAGAAERKLSVLDVPVSVDKEYSDSLSNGASVCLWAKCALGSEFDPALPVILGADTLAEKGVLSERVGESAAEKLLGVIRSKACVDEFLADNLVPFMALLPGSVIKTSKISNHTLTNIYVVEKFLGRLFDVKDNLIRVKE